MDAETGLISAVVFDDDVSSALDHRITEDWFNGDENRDVWGWLVGHFAEYGGVPHPETVRKLYPDFPLSETDEPLQFYIDYMVELRKDAQAKELLIEANEAIRQGDVEDFVAVVQTRLAGLAMDTMSLRDNDFMDETWEELEDFYTNIGDAQHMLGIPSGFASLDRALRGFQSQQLITFVGTPKAGKSTLMLCMAIAAQNYGRKVLFLSFEMSYEEQRHRYLAFTAHLSHTRLTTGALKEKEWESLEKTIAARKNLPSFVMSTDRTGSSTISQLAAKIDQHEPDIVFVDGVYLMDDEQGESPNSSQALTNITRGLKRLTQSKEMPLIVSTQVLTWKYSPKKGLQMNDVGYTSSFAQDSDALLGVESTNDEDVKRISIVAARNAASLRTDIRWDWDTGTFEELSTSSGEDDDDDEETWEWKTPTGDD